MSSSLQWFSSFSSSQSSSSPLKIPDCLYLGICGCTRSGKGLLSKNLCSSLGLNRNKILELDDYFDVGKMQSNVKPGDKYLNWEVPEALSFDRFVHEFTHNAGNYAQPLRTPITVSKGGRTTTYRSIFISEGFLLFEPGSDAEVLKLFDKLIFIGCSREVCKRRRMETKRETEEYFDTLIWPNYLKYNHPLYALKKSGELERDVLAGGEFKAIDGCGNSPAQVLNSALDFLASKERTPEDLAEEETLLTALHTDYTEYKKAHII